MCEQRSVYFWGSATRWMSGGRDMQIPAGY